MGTLDQVKSYFTGDIDIDNPDIRQALKDAFPDLTKDKNGLSGNELDDNQVLSASYIQERIVPQLMSMDEAKLKQLYEDLSKISDDKKNALISLSKDVESSLRYKPRDGNALPSNEQIPDRLKSSTKGVFKDAQNFLAEIANLRTDAEKEQALMAEIIASANRSVVKFDRYVQRGDGKQYGDGGNDWLEIDSNHINLRRPESSKNIRHNVENVPKIDFVTVVNEVVAMAQDSSVNVNVDGKMQSVGSGTRIEKLAYLASWMSALEEGTDKILPNMLAEAATNATVTAVSGVAGTVGDTASGLFDEYPGITTAGIALAVYASYRAGKGILSLGSIPFKGMAWAAGKFSVTRGLVPGLSGAGNFLDNFGRNGSTASAGAPGETPESSKKGPKKYGPILANGKLDEFAPKSENHKEYVKNTIATIEGDPTLSASEKIRCVQAFTEINTKFSEGKISVQEFVYKTSQIEKGIIGVLVTDANGKIQKGATIKKAATKIADSITGGKVDSKQSTYEAMKVATGRIQGSQYTTSSFDAGAKDIDFQTKDARELYEKWRDGLKRYVQLQEWGNYHKSIIQPQEKMLTDLQSDLTAKKAEVARLATLVKNTPSTIAQAQVMNGVGGTQSVSNNVPNPAYGEATEMLRGEMAAQKQLEQNIQTQRAKIAEVTAAAPVEGRPKSGNRVLWQADIQAQKTVLEGVLNDIDTHNGASAPKVPRTQLNFDARKIDPISWAKVVEKAIKH